MPEEKKKLSIREWIEHIWYYNKWLIILITPVILIIVISVFQMARSVEPDINVTFFGNYTVLPEGVEEIKNDFAGLIEDYGGDGKVTVGYLELVSPVSPIDGRIVNSEELSRFNTEIAAGDTFIFLVSADYYNHLKDKNILAPLYTAADDLNLIPGSADEYGIPIVALDIYKKPGFSKLPADTMICLRQSPALDAISYGRTVEQYTAHRKAFNSILSNVSDAGVAFLGNNPPDNAESLITSLCGDYNGDGKVNITYSELWVSYVMPSGNVLTTDEEKAAYMKSFDLHFSRGSAFVYFIGQEHYKYITEKKILMPLYEVAENLGNIPASADEYAVPLKDLEIYSEWSGLFPEDTLICFRALPEQESDLYKKYLYDYENSLKLFNGIINYKN